MGQAAKCNIAIFFNKDVETPLGLTSKTALQQAMLKQYYDTHPDAVGKPDITITEFETFGGTIELELYSTRSQNLDFQVDLLLEYLEQFDDIIEEVTKDKWIQN